ncbi:unnamed protein product [Blepharisma stoltei]|uniref:Uncharacterized protein n=1 Tax=Blepharisma stoltei TaxID=1481888 RepID=A0AAU9JLG0_9CILI|nr:unnamed protein product [Blepharisma stoltei]
MEISHSNYHLKFRREESPSQLKRVRVPSDILDSSRVKGKISPFPSSRNKLFEYKNRLKQVNSLIDNQEDLNFLENSKQQHEKFLNSLKHLTSLIPLLDTNYDISNKRELVITLLEILDYIFQSEQNEKHSENTKDCHECGCENSKKRGRSISPGWKMMAKEPGKNYIAKTIEVEDRLERCLKCNTEVIGRHTGSICEWCLDGNAVENQSELAVILKVYSSALMNPKCTDLDSSFSPTKSIDIKEGSLLPKNPEWLNFYMKIGNKEVRIRDSDSILCRIQYTKETKTLEKVEENSMPLMETLSVSPRKRSRRPHTPSFMKLTQASASKSKPFRSPLPEINPQSSKETLLQKILNLKSQGRTILKNLDNTLDEQFNFTNEKLNGVKEYCNQILTAYSRQIRSLITGIFEFLPEYSMGVEKCFKGIVLLCDFILDWYKNEVESMKDLISLQGGKDNQKKNYKKIIDELREEHLNYKIKHKSKASKMKNCISKYKHLIKLYEMELNRNLSED